MVTQNHGLVHYFAVGARRNTSKKSPHLDLISQIKFSANYNNSQSYLLQVESVNYFSNIKNNLKKIGTVMSFLEILYHLLPAESEDSEVYQSLVVFLSAINNSLSLKEDREISRKFGNYLLRHLGYPPPPANGLNISSYFELLMNRKIIGKEIS